MAKILYVDDDLQLSSAVEDWLAYEKHSLEVVHTGFEGWQKSRSDNQYDLLILDWDLPDINGIDILKRYRASGGKAPVLMLTGHTDVNDKELGLDSGADDYLTKPFHMKELSARIRALLRRMESQATVYKALGSGNEDVLKRANLTGTLLASRYEFLEVLGEGGMGMVFKAMHPLMEKLVAIKMLHSHQLKEESIERFKREAKAVSRLDHHNIITIHDFGVTEHNQPYMVMEFIDGKALADLMSEQGALEIVSALDICTQAGDGIAHAHDMGILHRDIKPSNIMLKQYTGRPPVVKILDFGFAKLKEPEIRQSIPSVQSLQLTQLGQVFGSPPYMAPEQVRGKSLDERSDIYALGCVAYEALTGCPPHLGENSMEVMLKHLEEDVVPLKELRPDFNFPEELEPVLFKALARSREERYSSMREFIDALEAIKLKLKMAQGGQQA